MVLLMLNKDIRIFYTIRRFQTIVLGFDEIRLLKNKH